MSNKSEFFVHEYSMDIIAELVNTNNEYLQRYPKAELFDNEMLLSPVFDDGKNIIHALDSTGRIAGYIPLQPQLVQDAKLSNMIWANMVILPAYIERRPLQDMLFEQAKVRAKEITSSAASKSTRIWFQHHISEVEIIEYVLSKGAKYVDSCLRMVRDLSNEFDIVPAPESVEIRDWTIKTDSDLETYITARNEAFPQAPITVKEQKHFLASIGDHGTTIAAFDGEKLVGAVSAYWIEEDNKRLGEAAGWTENVFVLAPWRSKGIADSMISTACTYLKEHGLEKAQLDPGASNQRAVHVYKRLGYRIEDESRQYWLEL